MSNIICQGKRGPYKTESFCDTVKPQKFELDYSILNLGHTRFRDNGIFMIYFNDYIMLYNNICFGYVKETSH